MGGRDGSPSAAPDPADRQTPNPAFGASLPAQTQTPPTRADSTALGVALP